MTDDSNCPNAVSCPECGDGSWNPWTDKCEGCGFSQSGDSGPDSWDCPTCGTTFYRSIPHITDKTTEPETVFCPACAVNPHELEQLADEMESDAWDCENAHDTGIYMDCRDRLQELINDHNGEDNE